MQEVGAQTIEEYKKQQEAEKREFAIGDDDGFVKFKKEHDEEIKKMDDEFKEFLKKGWGKYKLNSNDEKRTEPKPDSTPVYKEIESDKPSQVVVEVPEIDESIPETPDETVVVDEITPDNVTAKSISFDFYGADINMKYDLAFITSFPEEINEEIIANRWGETSNTYYSGIINQLVSLKNSMNLNDWAYYLLIKNLSGKLSYDRNARVFAEWFLLTKSKYKVRLAYFNSNLFLLLPSVNNIYEVPYFTFDDLKYYLVNGNETNIYTYNSDYPDAKKVMSLNLYKPIMTKDLTMTKKVEFSFNNQQYSLIVRYNKNTISFYSDYPSADYNVYFDASVGPQTKESLIDGLSPFLENRSEEDAVSLLLKFVQTAFEYETDGEQFGKEKMFFPDEMFYYPASDCEDRAVLFSYLVRELMGLKVVGLRYPNHMATAVNFNSDIAGSFVRFKGKKYVICDPTYVNAPIGSVMPGFINKKAVVIELKNPEL
jgi:hypothetical protein